MAGAFADSKGRYGYRRIKAVLKTGVSEKVVRRIMAGEGLVAHVPKRRRYSSYEGETTPAPANLVDRDFTAERPNEKWLTDISGIKARDGKVYLSPMIDCFDGKIVAYTAGFSPNAELANRMLVFCQVVIGQCGVSFPSEKAVGFSPVRNWPVIARVLLFHCIRA